MYKRQRNLLTVVQAIARMTLGKGGSLQSFNDRLAALGRAQGLVTQAGSDEMDLGDVVRLELAAHSVTEDGRLTVAGPSVMIGLASVQALALALHELATNAVKYGALWQDGAKLDVRWRIDHDPAVGDRVVLDWQESGVTMPTEPPHRGYGRQLIERSLAMALGTEATLDFGADGVRCRIVVPLGRRPNLALKKAKEARRLPAPVPPR